MATSRWSDHEDLIELARQRVGMREPRILPLAGWKAAAVLLLLYGETGRERIVLTVRTNDVEHHKGQISFPGGAMDPDDPDLIFTALRETEEEVGIPRTEVEVLGRLDDRITVSDFRVTPVLGRMREDAAIFRPSLYEVAEILEIPLRHLLDRTNRTDEPHLRAGMEELRPAYGFGNYRVWGATARILADFLDLLDGSGGGGTPGDRS